MTQKSKNKVAVCGDIHIGCRNDSQYFSKRHLDYFKKYFFPYLLENEITTVIQLGDIFDRRKFVNFSILQDWKRDFFNFFDTHNVHLYIPVGNHDCFFKNTNSVNSPNLLLSEFRNIHIYDSPTVVEIEGVDVSFVPWINSENYAESLNFIESNKSSILVGHLELGGFEMYKGQFNLDGLPADTFEEYDIVLSGHFHTRTSQGNIHYVGTPYEITWMDYNDPRGFHILDLSTKKLQFIENDDKIFNKIYYDDTKNLDYDYSGLTGNIVKLVVVNKKDFSAYEKFLEKLSTLGIHELKIADTISELDDIDFDDDKLKVADTQTLIDDYVDDYDVDDATRTMLKDLFKTLYIEALNLNQE